MEIKSILDTDLYKFSVSYAYMKLFPDAIGTFEFVDNKATSCSDVDIAFIRPGKEDSYTAKNILRRYLMKE